MDPLEAEAKAIAEESGWKLVCGGVDHGGACWWEFRGKYSEKGPPNYDTLDGMHEAEMSLSDDELDRWAHQLANVTTPDLNNYYRSTLSWGLISYFARATAAQRREAFLRTKDRWDDL
jgi:hypothetical protein